MNWKAVFGLLTITLTVFPLVAGCNSQTAEAEEAKIENNRNLDPGANATPPTPNAAKTDKDGPVMPGDASEPGRENLGGN